MTTVSPSKPVKSRSAGSVNTNVLRVKRTAVSGSEPRVSTWGNRFGGTTNNLDRNAQFWNNLWMNCAQKRTNVCNRSKGATFDWKAKISKLVCESENDLEKDKHSAPLHTPTSPERWRKNRIRLLDQDIFILLVFTGETNVSIM